MLCVFSITHRLVLNKPMKQVQKKKFITADGSPTLYMKKLNEYYHSKHGALQEANHVYINNGFDYWHSMHQELKSCTVFEMGFGTGLNTVLTIQAAKEKGLNLNYDSIEAYPLTDAELASLNSNEKINDHTQFKKIKTSLQAFVPDRMYDVIYYDAFGARAQPEMWEDNCFTSLVQNMNLGGVFVTYSAKGSVRRALQKLGLKVALIQGPPGKREMIRGVRSQL